VLRLGVPPTLAKTLRSTNPIESMIEITREHAKNVKNWRNGQMALRWAAAGMLEAGKQFPTRQRPTCTYPPSAPLSRSRPARLSDSSCKMKPATQPDTHRAATEIPRPSGQPPPPMPLRDYPSNCATRGSTARNAA
jgi:hypothetical protein